MGKEVNEEKRQKFIEYAGKRVNNVLHGIQILEPMARSATYDFTKQDVEDMFNAMQESLNGAKEEFYKKFDEKARNEKKTFSFASTTNEAISTIKENEVEPKQEITANTIEADEILEEEFPEDTTFEV